MVESLLTPPCPTDAKQAEDPIVNRVVQQGRLLVITGPSGVGKGTLVKQLRSRHPDLHFSVSVTTRSPRAGEVNGVHYFFLSREEFIQLREAGGLLEWAEYANQFYGTPKAAVLEKMRQGQDVLLEIELVGARQVFQQWPDAIGIFIQPPSLSELERRLRDRASDSEESIQNRLTQARKELAALSEFDFVVVNDDLDRAFQELDQLLYAK
jgi:guanylate kinase